MAGNRTCHRVFPFPRTVDSAKLEGKVFLEKFPLIGLFRTANDEQGGQAA